MGITRLAARTFCDRSRTNGQCACDHGATCVCFGVVYASCRALCTTVTMYMAELLRGQPCNPLQPHLQGCEADSRLLRLHT